MKRLNIIMSVVLFTCTTALIVALPIVVNLDFSQWAILMCIVIMGYTGAYLYFDNYIDLVKREYIKLNHDIIYETGYNDGWTTYQKTDGGLYHNDVHINSINHIEKYLEDGKDII